MSLSLGSKLPCFLIKQQQQTLVALATDFKNINIDLTFLSSFYQNGYTTVTSPSWHLALQKHLIQSDTIVLYPNYKKMEYWVTYNKKLY